MDRGIIILPPTEPDEKPIDTAAAAQSVAEKLEQQAQLFESLRAQAISNAADIAALKVQQIRQRAAEAEAAALADEPPKTKADTAAAELAALREMLDTVQSLPELQPMPEQLDGLPMPLDRITRQIFAQQSGRYQIRKSKSPQSPIIALLEIGATADTVQRLERLTAYDKRLLLTVGGLCENGIEQFSFSQLFDAMGGATRPGAKQLEQMRRAIARLCSCFIRLEFTVDSGTPNEKTLKAGFPLLDMEYTGAKYHGKELNAIRLNTRPKWLKIAEARKQITALPFAVFSDGLPLTENNIAVSDYILTEIAHMKRQKNFSRQMRLDSIAAGAGLDIAHREQRRRLSATVEKKLTHYASTGFIRGFERYAGGFTISP